MGDASLSLPPSLALSLAAASLCFTDGLTAVFLPAFGLAGSPHPACTAPGAGGLVPVKTRTGSPRFPSLARAPLALPERRLDRNTP